MRHDAPRRAALLAALSVLLLAAAARAQHREYYVRGRVLDTQKNPIPGVEVRLRDVSTSRAYDVKTDKQGTFKLAGLPHGVYQVTFAKEGYASRQDQWKLDTPQDTMQRVEVPDVVLATRSQVEDAQRHTEAEARLGEAADKIHKKDFDGAVTLLQAVLRDDPRNARALFFLGLAYSRKKMCREAIEPFTKVTELSPTFAAAWFELAVCYRQLGDLPRALEHYDENLQHEPGNADSLYNSGLVLFETNRIEEALARFERAAALKPDSEVEEMIARCYIHQAKFAAAVEHLEKARAATADPDRIATLDELLRQVRAQVR